MRLRSVRLLAVVFLAAAGAKGVSAGQIPAMAAPVSGPALRAGSTAGFSWNAEALSGFDEMELVLSLDGGRTFPLRVTGRLAPESGNIAWRVPALPTEHARLALRAGDGEDEAQEAIVFLGEEFSIRAEPNGSLEELFRVGGEWRTREALASPPDPMTQAGLAGAPSERLRAIPFWAPATEPSRSALSTVASGPSFLPRRRGVPPRVARSDSDATRPLSIPLRT